jgi:hypothetical protein
MTRFGIAAKFHPRRVAGEGIGVAATVLIEGLGLPLDGSGSYYAKDV